MFLLLVLTALFCFSLFANGIPIEDCGSNVGTFSRITISGCDDSMDTCILHKGQNATIDIDFTPDEVVADLKTVVHGTVLIVPVPFHVPHPDACTDPDSGIHCPLQRGKSYRYQSSLPVHQNYPSVSVTIKWELQDQNGKDIVCIELPARIQ